MQTPRGEHESACKGPEDGVLARRQESDVPGAERTLERAVGDGVRETEDQAGPCRLLSGFGNLFFLRKEISRKQIWSTLSPSKKSLWLPRRLWESNRGCYEDLLIPHDMPTLLF